MHNYPEVMFRAVNFSTEGQACMADKPPTDRRLTFNSASNLYSDAEAVGFLLLSTYMHSSPRENQTLIERQGNRLVTDMLRPQQGSVSEAPSRCRCCRFW